MNKLERLPWDNEILSKYYRCASSKVYTVNSKDLFQPQSADSMAPGADLTPRETIILWPISTPIKALSVPIKCWFGPQWTVIQPFGSYRPLSLEPFWLKLVDLFLFKSSWLQYLGQSKLLLMENFAKSFSWRWSQVMAEGKRVFNSNRQKDIR